MSDFFFKDFIEVNAIERRPFDDQSTNYQQRITAGKNIESEIRQKLYEELGWVTQNSSARNDQMYGIDGYIISKDRGATKLPTQTSFQLKIRKNASGNDILWEAIKPWNDSIRSNFENIKNTVFTGKDMRCKAELLIAVANNGRTIRLRKVGETMEIAKQMTEALIQAMRATGKTFTNTRWGQARLVQDPSQQSTYRLSGDISKINCFIIPGAYEWKQDIELKNPIGII